MTHFGAHQVAVVPRRRNQLESARSFSSTGDIADMILLSELPLLGSIEEPRWCRREGKAQGGTGATEAEAPRGSVA